MTGLLWSAVQEGKVDLPEPEARLLAQLDLAAVHRHHRMWAVLGGIADRFTEAGIPLAVIKGVVAEARWFARQGERPCYDLDLLVPAEHLVAAIGLLDARHPLVSAGTIEARHLRNINLVVDDVGIDLHHDPLKVGSGWRDPSAWWNEMVTVARPDGGTVQALDREAALVLWLLHLSRDWFRYLNGLVEAGRMMASDLDWGRVDRLATTEGISEPVAVAAAVVCRELGLEPVPLQARGWRRRLWERLWAPRLRLLGYAGQVRFNRRGQWVFALAAPGRAVDAAGWIVRSAFPPGELLDIKSPDLTGPYLWRLARSKWAALRRRGSLRRAVPIESSADAGGGGRGDL